jgi:hypothetical protein
MAQDFGYRQRRTEQLFKWVAVFAFILSAVMVCLAIAQWNGTYDIRQVLKL